MRQIRLEGLLVGMTVALSGCAPPFHLFSATPKSGPTVAQLVMHIECMLAKAAVDDEESKDKRATPTFAGWGNYVGAANLTVEVTHIEGLDPSVSFINPYKAAGTNVTIAVGAELNGTQHRT